MVNDFVDLSYHQQSLRAVLDLRHLAVVEVYFVEDETITCAIVVEVLGDFASEHVVVDGLNEQPEMIINYIAIPRNHSLEQRLLPVFIKYIDNAFFF